MEGINAADILGIVFLGYGIIDGYRKGFVKKVADGAKVRKGDVLIEADLDAIKAAGHPDVTVCIITEEGNAKNIQFKTGIQEEANKTEIVSFE